MKKILLTILTTLIVSSPGAYADQLFGDFQRLPDDIERGFSIGADFGLIALTGDKRTAQNPGFQLAFTTGVDLFKYLSFEGIYILGVQEAAPPPFDNVLQGGINWFMFNGALKGQLPLGRLYPFVEGGAGVVYTNPSFTSDDQNYKLNILFGAGVEYYTYLRHYSVYIKGLYHMISLPIDAVTISAGLKYTF